MPSTGMYEIGFAHPQGGYVHKPQVGLLEGAGAGPPTAGWSGYAPGARYIDYTNGVDYMNSGTVLSAVWVAGTTGVITGGATLTLATIAAAQAYSGKTVTMPAAFAATFPVATGSGIRLRFIQLVQATAVTLTCAGANLFGNAWVVSDNAAAVLGYVAAGSTIITFDGSTKGGLKGAIIELEDIAAGVWFVRTMSAATGTEATPFS